MQQNYSDLLNIDELWIKKNVFNFERWKISFYCKDCEKIVDADRQNPTWYIFKCKECWWKNISIWTQEWLKENYRLK